MIRSCFACGRSFPPNDELERLDFGSMVAFDVRRGRLWVICRWCSHWSLVPIEARWEAVEELDRRASQAEVIASTDAVSLVQIGSLKVLQVDRAPVREETWWRYGAGLRQRHRRYALISRAGGTAAAGATTLGMLALAAVPGMIELAVWKRAKVAKIPGSARDRGGQAVAEFDRWFRYGRHAWRGSAHCESCGAVLHSLAYKHRDTAVLRPNGSISVKCRQCRMGDPGYVISGPDAGDLVRRVLSYTNISGATDHDLNAAMSMVRNGTVTAASYSGPLTLPAVSRGESLALEIAATERSEAIALGWEVRDLEARWRSAEMIASIVDGELT
jgi:hypothetical protein